MKICTTIRYHSSGKLSALQEIDHGIYLASERKTIMRYKQ